MAKFDRINEKRRAENSIKQAKQREEEKRYVPHSEERSLTFGDDFIPSKELDNINLSVGGYFPPVELEIGNSLASFFRVETYPEPLEARVEKRLANVHEELAKLKQENRELKTLVINLIKSIRKEGKKTRDLRQEYHDTLLKYGDPIVFIKNYLDQMIEENKIKNENADVPLDNREKKSRRFQQYQKT